MDSSIAAIGNVAIQQATATRPPQSNGNIDKAAQDFSGMFFAQMLQPMFEGVGVDPVFGGGHGEEVMRSFLIQEYGKIVTKSSNFGLGDAVKREMLRVQANAGSALTRGGNYD